MWFYLLIGIFLIFMGLSVHVFKWYFLISGYNTMPKEKRPMWTRLVLVA
jgi:hypothetical protein